MSKSKSKAATPGFVRGRFAEVATLVNRTDLGEMLPQLPKDVNEAVVDLTNDAFKLMFPVMKELHTLPPAAVQTLCGLLHYMAAKGFTMALYRYADELNRVPELKAWHRKRGEGLNKGRDTQTQVREAKYQRIRATWAQLEAEGKPCTYDAVAVACECSRSTVERAINSRTVKRPKR